MLIILIGLVGLVNIITRSYIMQYVREHSPGKWVRYMLNCPQCTGFWVGVVYGIYSAQSFSLNSIVDVVIMGGVVSMLASCTIPLLDYLSFAKTAIINKITGTASEE